MGGEHLWSFGSFATIMGSGQAPDEALVSPWVVGTPFVQGKDGFK